MQLKLLTIFLCISDAFKPTYITMKPRRKTILFADEIDDIPDGVRLIWVDQWESTDWLNSSWENDETMHKFFLDSYNNLTTHDQIKIGLSKDFLEDSYNL